MPSYWIERGEAYTRAVFVGDPPRADSAGDRKRTGPRHLREAPGARSRQRMRIALAGLPVAVLRDRPLFIALTLPSDWRRWTPDAATWERQRCRMVDRWEYQFGRLVGVWVKEFQQSGRPHMHWYIACPESVSDDDYHGLQRRTVFCRQLADELGKAGSRYEPSIGYQKKGMFKGEAFGGRSAMWMRRAWSEVVTGAEGSDRGAALHYARGVDVRTSYWSDDAGLAADKRAVLAYMAQEFGKQAQKRPPHGFGRMGRWWGLFGRDMGCRPCPEIEAVDYEEFRQIADRIHEWSKDRVRTFYRGAERGEQIISRMDLRRPGTGSLGLGLFGDELVGLEAEARGEAAKLRAQRRSARP